MPYIQHSTENPFLDVAGAVAQRCESRMISVSTGEIGPHLDDAADKKHVICMGMPPIDGISESRRKSMSHQGVSYVHKCL